VVPGSSARDGVLRIGVGMASGRSRSDELRVLLLIRSAGDGDGFFARADLQLLADRRERPRITMPSRRIVETRERERRASSA
jgi:hypothetical protein